MSSATRRGGYSKSISINDDNDKQHYSDSEMAGKSILVFYIIIIIISYSYHVYR